jgi:hypothetical protein
MSYPSDKMHPRKFRQEYYNLAEPAVYAWLAARKRGEGIKDSIGTETNLLNVEIWLAGNGWWIIKFTFNKPIPHNENWVKEFHLSYLRAEAIAYQLARFLSV